MKFIPAPIYWIICNKLPIKTNLSAICQVSNRMVSCWQTFGNKIDPQCDDTTTCYSCAAINISMIFLPAAATEVPGPKIATTPAS